MDDRSNRDRIPSLGRGYSSSQFFQRNIEMSGQGLRSAPAIRHVLAERSKGSPGPDDRFQQPSGCRAIAELKAVGNDVPDSKMLRQRSHEMIERLADQNDISTGPHKLLHLFNAFLLQVR